MGTGGTARAVGCIALAACGRLNFGDVTGDAGIGSDTLADAPTGICATRTFTIPRASEFSDDFSTGMLSDRWFPTNPCVDQVAGELVATVPSSMNQFCHAWTDFSYHLTCDSVMVKVPEATSAAVGVQTFIYAAQDFMMPAGGLSIVTEGGNFNLGYGGTDVPVPGGYNAQNDVWWRLVETGGELVFHTSPDGTNWIERLRIATPISLDNVYIALGAGAYMPLANPGRGRFHCYNRLPPCS